LGNKISHKDKQRKGLNKNGIPILDRGTANNFYYRKHAVVEIVQKTGIRNIFNRMMTFFSEFLAKI